MLPFSPISVFTEILLKEIPESRKAAAHIYSAEAAVTSALAVREAPVGTENLKSAVLIFTTKETAMHIKIRVKIYKTDFPVPPFGFKISNAPTHTADAEKPKNICIKSFTL